MAFSPVRISCASPSGAGLSPHPAPRNTAECKTKGHPSGCPFVLEATPGFEPGNEGFADPCLTTWLCRHVRGQSTILFPHKHMRTSSPVFSQGPGQRQLLSKIKGAYLAPIKNGAGDGARTRFPVSRERRSAIRRSPPGPPIPRAFGPGWRQRVHGSRWPHPCGGSLLR